MALSLDIQVQVLLSCERTMSDCQNTLSLVCTGCLLTLQAFLGKQVAQYDHDLPALELLIEIELEDGSRDSIRRAVDYQQGTCKRGQARLDQIMEEKYKPTKHIEVGPLEVSRCLAKE